MAERWTVHQVVPVPDVAVMWKKAGVSAVTADVSFDVYLNSPILDKTKNYTTMIFNEQGFIDIDEMIAQEPSFQKIMEDGVVTSEELHEQTERVIK